MNNFRTKRLARAGVIAAMYVAFTFLVLPLASGAIQFRVSEALTLLPLFYVEAIPALFIGCMLANIISGAVIWDVIFGSVITLVAASITYLCGKFIRNNHLRILTGGLAPVFLNAFLLPVIWYFAYGQLEYVYIAQVGFLVLGQGVAIYVLGSLLYYGLLALQKKGIKVLMPFNNNVAQACNNSTSIKEEDLELKDNSSDKKGNE